ncbi:nitroreductase/quinone reductase family protein [Mycobacterium sp. MMS18-G62]
MRFGLLPAAKLRAMYKGGRGNAEARSYARLWIRIMRLGVLPRRWVVLEVPGRRTGRPTEFPLGMADAGGQWYLVSMLGEQCNWVRNIRAAGYQAVLWRRRARRCELIEVPPDERAPILRRYLQKVPGGRPHIPVSPGSPLPSFAAISAQYPVFRVRYLDS